MRARSAVFVVIFAVVSVALAAPQDTIAEKKPICDKYEQWNECGPIEGGCLRECANRYNKDIACVAVCTPACYCKLGYIRREYGGSCIPKRDCPRKY